MATLLQFNDEKIIVVDATPRRSEQKNNKLTTNIIEDGSNVADHIVIEPLTMTFDGVISDVKNNQEDSNNKDIEARRRIEKALNDRELITVITPIKRYENYVIETFNTTQEVNTGKALVFSMTIKEVLTAISKTVKVPKSAIGKGSASQIQNDQDRFKSPEEKGKSETSPANEAQQTKASLLKQAFNFLSGG